MSPDPFQLIDQEYQQEVEELRLEFAGVDCRNPESLRRWFTKHPYLSMNDLSRIAGVNLKTVQGWRHRLGMPVSKRNPPRRWQFPRLLPAAPPDWQTGAWLEQQYPRLQHPRDRPHDRPLLQHHLVGTKASRRQVPLHS